MKKISTLFKKNPENLALVINEVDPQNQWVLDGEGIATRKFDGTAAAIINGDIYKRYDVKKGRKVPPNAIPCQDPDEMTGHWPHWVKCDRANKEDKYFFEGLDALSTKEDATYELCGPKVNGNREQFERHILIKHGRHIVHVPDLSFEELRYYFEKTDYEGIVFHHPDGRMCKIRKSDFGIKR